MRKIVLVTGANRGIGFEIARQLSVGGHMVHIAGRSKSKIKEAANDIGNGAQWHVLDVADPGSIEDFAKSFDVQYLDVLINNAGIFQDREYDLLSVPLDNFESTMDVNFRGPLLLVRSMLDLLQKSEGGRIINMSSGLGSMNDMGGGFPGYRISKAALNAMTSILSHDLSSHGIMVNSVCPGWVKTEMGGTGASREVSKGAETAVWLATEPKIPNGAFLRDKQIIEW